jgi:hypothetical protein
MKDKQLSIKIKNYKMYFILCYFMIMSNEVPKFQIVYVLSFNIYVVLVTTFFVSIFSLYVNVLVYCLGIKYIMYLIVCN